MPLQRRLPKRGFKNPFRVEYAGVNVGRLCEVFQPGEVVDLEAMHTRGVAPRAARLVKILGNGEASHSLTVRAHAFSKSAQEKIQAAGGTTEVLPTKKVKASESGDQPDASPQT
jgi:large subunit ribosomal protein L15